MSDRLSTLDVSFLYIESLTNPMHVGGVAVFDPPPGPVDFDDLIAVIDRRLRAAPRYRQKLQWSGRRWPGQRLHAPVWVDDPTFDISRHVQRLVLPQPGSPAQLYRLVGELQSRPLERTRALWELTIIEGLDDGGFAIVTKAHHAMADGIGATDIASVILDAAGTDGTTDLVARPAAAPTAGPRSAYSLPAAVRTAVGLAAAVRTNARPAPRTSLNSTSSTGRLLSVSRTRLDDHRRVRTLVGGTVNDVVLAVVTGALRRWLLERGDRVPARGVRALVPLSVRTGPAGELGNRLSTYFVDLPVAQTDPLRRLQQVSAAMAQHKRRNQSAGATAALGLAASAPAAIHAAAARTVNTLSRMLFNVVVSNVPGPQHSLYLGGARVRDIVPVVPLAGGQAVSIGLLSYDGGMFYGLNADRTAAPDVDRLARAIERELACLVALADAAGVPTTREERA